VREGETANGLSGFLTTGPKDGIKLRERRPLTSSDPNLLLAAALGRNCHGFPTPVTSQDARRIWRKLPALEGRYVALAVGGVRQRPRNKAPIGKSIESTVSLHM
jgi:hypothetical protein